MSGEVTVIGERGRDERVVFEDELFILRLVWKGDVLDLWM